MHHLVHDEVCTPNTWDTCRPARVWGPSGPDETPRHEAINERETEGRAAI